MRVLCAIYGNTGFNVVNIPDTPARLQLMADGGKCQILFNEYLELNTTYTPKIIINKKWDEINTADYVFMTTNLYDNKMCYCYTVANIQMLADDVAELTLIIDAINTLGGLQNVEVLQGIVERRTIAVSEDLYGKYSLNEPFTPQQPLAIKIGNIFGSIDNNKKCYYEKVLKTVDNVSNVLRPTGGVANQEVLLIPATQKINDTTTCEMMMSSLKSCKQPISEIKEINGTELDEINKLRQYGMENAILTAWELPTNYGGFSGANLRGNLRIIPESATGITLNYSDTYNKKAIYGEFSKLVLYSICSGNKAEFNPEDIVNNNTFNILIITDPRANGKPTAYFEYFKGANLYDYGVNGVAGMVWNNAPIVYTDKSGSNVDRLNFETQQKLRTDKFETKARQERTNLGITTLADTIQGGITTGAVGVVGALGRSVGKLIGMEWERSQALELQQLEMGAESEIFNRNQTYVQPEVNFARNESVRDFLGNNFLLTQYQLSQTDLINYDTFLTQFGYNVGGETYLNTMSTNRPDFNFIKFTSVSLKNEHPLWIRKQAEEQLKVGVRLWHKEPNTQSLLASGNR